MWKKIILILLLVFAFSLSHSNVAVAAERNYVDTTDGYEFSYPNGWVQVKVANGPDLSLIHI